MTCYHPITAWKSIYTNENGKRPLVFDKRNALAGSEIQVACGRCIGCRLDYSLNWAIRCVHEAKTHTDNCFITLTFKDEYLDKNLSLQQVDYQKFMKRLRKAINPQKVRYYACGEYGSKNHRPHWHACLFGWRPDDLVLWQVREGIKLYRSSILEKLWPYGFCTIGEVTFESAAYVARYMTKKIKGDMSISHYAIVDYETGEIIGQRQKERSMISTKPGIGADFAKKYIKDIYPDDFILHKGRKLKPPKYYDKIYDSINEEGMKEIKAARVESAKKRKGEYTPERLEVKEGIKTRKVKKLTRKLEGDRRYD